MKDIKTHLRVGLNVTPRDGIHTPIIIIAIAALVVITYAGLLLSTDKNGDDTDSDSGQS